MRRISLFALAFLVVVAANVPVAPAASCSPAPQTDGDYGDAASGAYLEEAPAFCPLEGGHSHGLRAVSAPKAQPAAYRTGTKAARPLQDTRVSSGSGPESGASAPLSPFSLSTEAGPPAKPASTLLIYFENDLFYNTDRYYTNAVQARYISPDLHTLAENDLLPDAISRLLGDVPFPGSQNAMQYNISLGAGQQIYTPRDTQIAELQPDDRPYAGYLYGFLALHAKKRDRLDTLELAAGIIGPSALGEQAQNEVHRFRDIDTAKGWDHQLSDEPAVMLSWARTWRLNAEASEQGWGWDVLPRTGVNAGIPFTQACLGSEVRLGWNLPPDFGSSIIQPGSGIYAPTESDEVMQARAFRRGSEASFMDRMSLYVFAGAEGRAVAHNTFLDGNTWKDSPSVDKFPLVGELRGGVGMRIYDVHLTYTHVYRSKEFHGQDRGQNFGSITLGYTF